MTAEDVTQPLNDAQRQLHRKEIEPFKAALMAVHREMLAFDPVGGFFKKGAPLPDFSEMRKALALITVEGHGLDELTNAYFSAIERMRKAVENALLLWEVRGPEGSPFSLERLQTAWQKRVETEHTKRLEAAYLALSQRLVKLLA
jgi:hypothetical protein